MTYTKKTLSEIKLIHGDYGNFIKGQKLPKDKEKKYKMPPYKDLAASNEIDGEPLDEKCWPGYEKKGMKTMFGKRYPNCVKKKKTRKEEYSDWRSELEENKEPELPKINKNVKSMNQVKITPGKTYSPNEREMINRMIAGSETDFEDKLGDKLVDQAKKSKNSASYRAKMMAKKGTLPRKGLAKLAARAGKAISKTPKGALVAAGLVGAVAGARAIGGALKKRKDAAIEKQVDKYVSDRKAPIKKVNYMPDNMYTVKRDKDGKASGTGDKIRVVPGTRTTPKPTQPDNTKKSRFSQHTRMKLGNYGSLSPYDDAIEKQVDKYVKDRKGPIRKIKEEKKMTKAQIKKRDEIADAISTREMNKRYGDKNVKYAIATKLAMKEDNIQEILDKKDIPHVKKLVKKLRDGSKTHAKQADDLEVAMKTENTAIESELLIQDWNKDDIKFTEIETVDIIKPKPLKEGMAGALIKGGSKFIPALMTGIGAAGTIMQSKKKETSDDEDAEKIFSEVEKQLEKKNPSTGNRSRAERRIAELKGKLRLNKDRRRMEKSFKKPASDKNEHYDWREDLGEDWQKVNRKDKTDGLSRKAVKAYRRENPGSKLQTAVTKDPKKLKKGSKSAKRRLSFCRRMKGMKKKLTSAKTRRDPDSRINKALRRWNC